VSSAFAGRKGHTSPAVAADPRSEALPEKAAKPEAPKPEFTSEDLRYQVPAEIRNVAFPVSVRGYDREAVDAYVRRVNRVIAELEVSRSPEAAVRHALDRVGKQTIAVLQEARDSADKLMAAAREEGDEAMARAKEEAANLVVNASADADRTRAEAEEFLAGKKNVASDIVAKAQAEVAELRRKTEEELATRKAEADTRMREVRSDTDAVWKQRNALLGETHELAQRLQEVASGAAARIAPQDDSAGDDEGARAEQRPVAVARTGAEAGPDEPAVAPGQEPVRAADRGPGRAQK
jgi:DivIVA domain-containing protein